ncbi:DUF4405 domain-containing protein [Sulfurimonas lithotrophica]|uniref:DUF4405 domain-containing protein n=1 Tax=Sulfurimonas lithotrophica TaxID=2590022 RepID=A0A5P8P1B5_9BACT|nr:DUF4405 domain-containing protein [Sulfurimonas lithotrophica]QFR49420.1 DUF4405 domain-containing protein [Sulfurimonas lithotrophica]
MKKITSLSLAFSFLIMSYTGVILYIVPQGKIAYWSDWHLLGLSKTQYGDIHSTSMFTMLFFAFLHIYYNWKPLISYIKDKSKNISFTKKELLIAFGINIFFVLGTLYMFEPIKSLIDFQNGIKDYWAKEYGEPPYGHAEESRLSFIAKRQNIDLEQAKKNLSSKGISFQEDDTLLDIARSNSIAPSEVYKIMQPKSNNMQKPEGIPTSLGRRTLQELHDMGKIDLTNSIKILKSRSLDANPNDRIKQIADELGLRPIDVYQLIKLR